MGGRWQSLLRSAAIALVLSGLATHGALAAQFAWRTEVVDSSTGFGPSMAIDSVGHAHVAYGGGTMRYAVQQLVGWSVSTIPMGASLAALAIGSDDRARLAFLAVATDDLVYAEHDGSGWTFETVDAAGNTGWFSELRLDSNGFPHVVYYRLDGADQLKYAFKDASGWHLEVIATDVLIWNGFALGPGDVPHVAYTTSSPDTPWGGLKYGTRSDTGWSWQVVETNQGGTDLSLAVDALGRPHIAYRGAGETLKYATLNGGQWQYAIIDNDRPTGWETSIAVDANGRPHIAYHQVFNRAFPDDPTRGHTKYAGLLPNGQWFTEFVDREGFQGDPSIALDEDGQPRVAYKYIASQPFVCNGTICLGGQLRYAEPPLAVLSRLP